MKRLWVLYLALAALLAGCFQQAGEAFQPANNTVEPLPLNITNTPSGVSTQTTPVEGEPTRFPATSTLPITVISPATRGPASPTPQQPTAANTTQQPGAQTVTTPPTQAFITPGGPPLPIPSNTPAPTQPTSGSGAAGATPSGLITPTALSGGSADGCTYIVQPGDNLFRIAVNHNTTVEEMRAANPELVGEAPILQPGQVLQIPNCGAAGSVTQSAPPTPASASGATTGGTVYTVQAGDTLFSIARRFGVTVQAIVEANNLANPDSLSIGQQLVIPPAS
jgi:LysM repeat protein